MEFSIAATMVVKNEEDILPFVLSNTLDQVDALYIIDNNSVDNTKDVISSFGKRITFYDCKKEHYNHKEWMTSLANMAIKDGFDWVVPIDADEMWSNLSCLRNAQCNLFVIEIIKNHMFTNYTGPFHPSKMPYYKEEETLRNAFRSPTPVEITEGSHHIKGIGLIGETQEVITIDHYPFRSEAQYFRKVVEGADAMITRNTSPEEAHHWKSLAQNLDKFKIHTGFRKMVKLL